MQYSFVVSGTPAFWHRFATRLARLTPVAATVFHHFGPVKNIRLGAPDTPTAVLDPESAGSAVRYASPFAPRDVVANRHFSGLFYQGVAGVARNWGRTWRPIVLTFDADWARRRGLGTCYVPIPELTSIAPGAPAGAMEHAAAAVSPETASTLPAPPGYTRFAIRTQGEVQPNESAPRPAFFNANEATVSCTSAAADALHAGLGVKSPDGTTYAFSTPPSASSSPYGCEGFIVIKTSAADQVATAALVLLGIGVTLTVELLRARVREWRASTASERASPKGEGPPSPGDSAARPGD